MFETIRDYVKMEYGQEQWERMMYLLPQRTVDLFANVDLSEWYPESELRRFLHLSFDMLAEEDEAKFAELAGKVALVGIRRFFKMIPTLESGRFVLRNVPSLFRRIRRGPATVRVEPSDDGRVLLHYEDFRYCRDRLYRSMAVASCQAAAFAATGKMPEGKVQTWDRSSMVLAFTLDE